MVCWWNVDGVSGVPVACVGRGIGCKYNDVVVIIYTVFEL